VRLVVDAAASCLAPRVCVVDAQVSDQRARQHCRVADPFRLQQILQAGLLLFNLVNHAGGCLQPSIQLGPVGPLQFFIFGIAVSFQFALSPALGIHPRMLVLKALSSGVSVTSLPGRPYHMTGQDELAKVKPPAIKD